MAAMGKKGQSGPVDRYFIEAQTGIAFAVAKKRIVRVIDVEGQQVADLVCFARQDNEEYLSSGRTLDYNEKIFQSAGDILYSNRSNPMLSIVHDPVGRHDFLLSPCSREMFRRVYGIDKPHPNCLDNLSLALKPYGITSSQIPTAFNIFMNIAVDAEGNLAVRPPQSKAGDFIDLRAEMDLIVGVTACSARKCNNFRCTPVEVQIYAK